MIYSLNGTLQELLPNGAVVEVNGVGYGLEIPLSTLCALPSKGSKVHLSVHTHVREDSIRLFGFSSVAEKDVFEILISLNGIGPKVALAILSTLTLRQIHDAVRFEQAQTFEAVPGVGKRLSERLMVELKPKLKRLDLVLSGTPVTAPQLLGNRDASIASDQRDLFLVHLNDVHSALENLGFKEKLVVDTINSIRNERPADEFQELMRIALQKITGASQTPDARRVAGGVATATDTDLF
jgi:Holliday junction DNA helicase RuvA